jgi:hypothetical protein
MRHFSITACISRSFRFEIREGGSFAIDRTSAEAVFCTVIFAIVYRCRPNAVSEIVMDSKSINGFDDATLARGYVV